MDSEHPDDKLSAYADGALSGESEEALEAHLDDCEKCRHRLEVIRSSKHRLAELGASTDPTDVLRRTVERHAEKSAGESDKGDERRRGWGHAPRAVVAVLAVVAAVGVGYYFGTWQTARTAQVPSDWEELLVRDHLHSKPAAKPMEVTGDAPDAIVEYFRGKIEFEPVIPTVPEAELIGGRLCKLAGEHVQLLFYRHEGRVLSLFVADELSAPKMCRSTDDHGVCIRDAGELRLMLVGRGTRRQLNALLKETRI